MPEFPLVSIISVNFNGLSYTLEMLASLQKLSYPAVEVIIVDNGSSEDAGEITRQFPGTVFIRSEQNLGFAGGNNLGIARAKGKYLLFLNNDTEVHPGFLQPLVHEFEQDSRLGLASPKIVYDEGGKRHIIQYAGSTGINPYTMRGAKIGSFAEDRGQYDKVYDTELGHGAAMMIPMAVIEEVGLMPDIFFLYYEEHDWCEMIKRAGYKVRYVGTSVIYHKESMTVGRNSPIKAYYMVRGRLLFTRRNTRGIRFLSSSLFFALLALPKNALGHLLRREFKLLKAYLLGVGWHLKGRNAKVNPQLSTNAAGERIISGDTFQQVRRF